MNIGKPKTFRLVAAGLLAAAVLGVSVVLPTGPQGVAYAAERQTVQVPDDSQAAKKDLRVTPQVKSGWSGSGKVWQYYKDSKPVANQWVVTKKAPLKGSKSGLQRYWIDADGKLAISRLVNPNAKRDSNAGYWAYATAKGYVARGKHVVGSKVYLANNDGKLEEGNAKGFLVTKKYDGGKMLQRYYIDPAKHAAVTGKIVKVKGYGSVYPVPKKGYVLRNTVTVQNKKAYLANNDGKLKAVNVAKKVPLIYQNPQLPTGCESVALTMVLRGYGFKLGKTTIVDKYLYYSGWDFVNSFVGNPYGNGAGIYAPGIVRTANRYLKAQGSSLRAHDLSGKSFSTLVNYANAGIPVLVWSTMYMHADPGYSGVWANGRQWYNWEHCVVLKGSSGGKVQVNDALSGSVNRSYTAFANLYNRCGKMAVAIW